MAEDQVRQRIQRVICTQAREYRGGGGAKRGWGGWVPPTNASLPHDPGHSDEEHHTPNVQHAAYLWKGGGGIWRGGGAKQCSVHLSSVVH